MSSLGSKTRKRDLNEESGRDLGFELSSEVRVRGEDIWERKLMLP